MYSSPAPPFAQQTLAELPANLRTWMTVRNDDIYSFRWGDPEYARAYIRDLPGPDKLAGYYMGPDGYIWGREFISTEPETPRQLVIKKQWYSFMLWGRLSYDPHLPDALFERTLAGRFPEVPAQKLFAASSARLEDHSADHALLLGRHRPQVVPRSLPQPSELRRASTR